MPWYEATDPRNTDRTLTVEFDIDTYGTRASFDDPGSGPEITITEAIDADMRDVWPALRTEHRDAIENDIIGNYDFDESDDYDDGDE